MKTNDKLILIIQENKELTKTLKGIQHYTVDQFIHDAQRYISAISQGRIVCNVASVSKSGMSRNIKFLECSKYKKENRYTYLNFYAFF